MKATTAATMKISGDSAAANDGRLDTAECGHVSTRSGGGKGEVRMALLARIKLDLMSQTCRGF